MDKSRCKNLPYINKIERDQCGAPHVGFKSTKQAREGEGGKGTEKEGPRRKWEKQRFRRHCPRLRFPRFFLPPSPLFERLWAHRRTLYLTLVNIPNGSDLNTQPLGHEQKVAAQNSRMSVPLYSYCQKIWETTTRIPFLSQDAPEDLCCSQIALQPPILNPRPRRSMASYYPVKCCPRRNFF